jgi:hypothetical protein
MAIRKAYSMLSNFSWRLWKRHWSKLKIRSKTAKENNMISNLMRKTRNKNRRVILSRRLLTTKRKCKIWLEKQMKDSTLIGRMKGNATLSKELAISLNQKSNSSMRRKNNRNRSSIIILMKKIIRIHSKTSFPRTKRAR